MSGEGSGKVVDMHCHVGLLGDDHPQWGKMSEWYRQQIVYKVFLFYGRIDADPVFLLPDQVVAGRQRVKRVTREHRRGRPQQARQCQHGDTVRHERILP